MATADLDRSVYVAWEHPLEKGELCMEAVPLRALPARTLRSANEENAAEVGGILWGNIVPTEESKLVLIRHAEFVNGSDKVFNSNDTDLSHLQSVLKRPRFDIEPIGYFRSSVRDSYRPTERDLAFLDKWMPGTDIICLVIEPEKTGTCIAHFYFRQDGEFCEQNALDVPLLPLESYEHESVVALDKPGAAARNGRATPSSSTPEQQIQPAAKPIKLKQEVPARRDAPIAIAPSSPYLNWGAALAALIAVAIAAYLFLKTHKVDAVPGTTASKGEIALQVNRRPDGQLDLSWDRDAVTHKNPIGAKLLIHDGASNRELELNDEQLRSGRLAYFPMGDDIDFRLELFLAEGRAISESIRVLSPAAYAARREALDALMAGNANQIKILAPAPEKKTPGVPAPQPGTVTSVATPPPSGTAVPGSAPVPAAQPPATPLADLAEAAPVVPPVADSLRNSTDFGLPTSSIPAAPAPPETPAPVASKLAADSVAATHPPAAAPAPTDNTAHQEEQGFKPKPVSSVNTALPVPVRQVTPNVKLFGTSVLVRDLEVDVEVILDGLGRVTKATPVGVAKGSLLATQAVAAAQQWRFEPARRNGVGVPSTYLIRFRFRATANKPE
jgi:hypothetical protein